MRTFPHRRQAVMVVALRQSGGVEAAAVVGDAEAKRCSGKPDLQTDVQRLRMLDGIVNRLLADAENLLLEPLRIATRVTGDGDLEIDWHPGGRPLAGVAQCGDKVSSPRGGVAQFRDGVSSVADVFLDQD